MKIRAINMLSFSLFIISYILYICAWNSNYGNNEEFVIWGLSVLGILELIFCILSWEKVDGSFFTPYTIFILFAFLFTYGQCIMWAFGIHTDTEIGKRVMYSNIIGVAQKEEIIKTQMLTLVGILGFHTGALFACPKLKEETTNKIRNNDADNSDFVRDALYKVSLIFAIISFPAAIYNSIRLLFVYRTYGYGANLYNSSVIASANNVIILVSMMFFPSIVGLLIGSNYRKNVMVTCYSFFAVYALICTIGGDRGEWLYPFVFLVWLHNSLYKRLNRKTIIKYAIIGFAMMVVLSAVKNARTYGLTLDALIEAIKADNNPIASTLFETGRQMAIPLIFIKIGWGIYPYGNTYLMAFLGMITERVITTFIYPDYVGVSGWLSQRYLGISYGAGFSFIAEAYVNYGPYLSVIALVVVGFIYSKVMNIRGVNTSKEPLKLFFKLTTAEALIVSIRNPMLTALKTWFYSTVIIYIVCSIVINIRNRRLVK